MQSTIEQLVTIRDGDLSDADKKIEGIAVMLRRLGLKREAAEWIHEPHKRTLIADLATFTMSEALNPAKAQRFRVLMLDAINHAA